MIIPNYIVSFTDLIISIKNVAGEKKELENK